jgi:hypothetical protein
MSIIGICGFQGSGKDTLADILVTKYGYTKLSFAGVLKDIVAILFDWDRDLVEGSTPESRKWRETIDPWWAEKLNMPNLTPRLVLQLIGTDVFRNHFHPNIWVTCVERKLKKYPKVVITDCRFPNEIQVLRDNGAKIIKIFRNEIPQLYTDIKLDKIEPPKDLHPSEWKWIKSNEDLIIMNNSTIEDLEEKIKLVI